MSYRRGQRTSAPKFIKAKYAGVCAETKKEFSAGADILYSGGKAYCENSKTYQDYASAEFDRVMLGANY